MSDEAHPHEIIIIKRHGGGHEDGHHGGAWKIAYADFVTAMMAFCLVMCLLSANEKTKAAIVKYFNPIQLVDSTPQPPGLGDPSEKTPSPKKNGAKPAPDKEAVEAKEGAEAVKPEKAKEERAREEKPKEESKKDDVALFRDPYAALNEIGAKDAPPSRGGTKAPNDGSKGGAGTAAAAEGKGGDAYRDPFDPVPLAPRGAIDGAADSGRSDPDLAAGVPMAPPPTADAPAAAAAPAEPVPPSPAAAPLPAEPAARAAELKAKIDGLVKAVAAASGGPQPKVDVKATAEGLLIGLTDDARFSMFASASAEPSPRTVTLMEKIGRLLKAQKGRIVVRGYTDSRKYRSEAYDNWRLSSARADMAHYMLVRGGVDDARFERIEGYADRQPRNPKDPEGPENRRIEILLRDVP